LIKHGIDSDAYDSSSAIVYIRCRGNVFTLLLPSTEKRDAVNQAVVCSDRWIHAQVDGKEL
jgi:hypothetical protein